MDADRIRQLAQGGESLTVEFKERLPPNALLAQVLAAFGNTAGGVLLVGVTDKGNIVGVAPERIDDDFRSLHAVARSIFPRAIEVGVVQVDGKSVLYANVSKVELAYSPLVTASGLAPRRQGTSTLTSDVLVSDPSLIRHAASQRPRIIEVFVAMSFREEEEPALADYFAAIKRLLDPLKDIVHISRMDLHQGDCEISQEIMNKIDAADIVIADFTLSPQNVYFELGYARGRKRRIIQIARKGTRLEFDVQNWKTVFYKNATELEASLKPELLQALRDVQDQSRDAT